MTMQLDHDQLHRLLEVLSDSDIQEFRLEGDDFRLEVRRNLPAVAVAAAPVAAVAAAPAAPMQQQHRPPTNTKPSSARLTRVFEELRTQCLPVCR